MSTTAVRERPILFSPQMVRALLAGTKTQTRRVVKPTLGPEAEWDKWEGWSWKAQGLIGDIPREWLSKTLYCPYGTPGDMLYVRESVKLHDGRMVYVADGAPVADCPMLRTVMNRPAIRPQITGIHMFREFCRLRLEVVKVRVERADDISEEDARAESFRDREDFFRTFYDLNKRAKRGDSPWVWVVEFRRVEA